MNADHPTVTLAGNAMVPLVRAASILQNSDLPPFAVIGGVAVAVRLGRAVRATADLDAVTDYRSEPGALDILRTRPGSKTNPSNPHTITIDGIDIQFQDVTAVSDDEIRHLDTKDVLYIAGHATALTTAEVVAVRAGNTADVIEAQVPVATTGALIAMKLHAYLDRRGQTGPDKRPGDLWDLYNLLQFATAAAARDLTNTSPRLREAVCVTLRKELVEHAGHARAALRSSRDERYQARYRVDGKLVGAPSTFRTKRDAEAYLSTVRADMERGTWVNPIAGKVTLREYSTKWLEHRPDLRPRTVELYEGELRLHILPALGDLELAKITPTKVRDWHSGMLKAGKPGPTTVAKCYRLLHAILNTAVADELLVRNPCVIKGAGQEKAPERPIASIPQVFEIADTIEPRFRAMVLVGAFVGLRLGKMLALTRERIDLLQGCIKVVEQYQELRDGTHILGPPKSDAGIRTVAIPAMLKPELEAHLATCAAPGKKDLVFGGPNGQPLRRATWYSAWNRTMTELGIEGMKPHDLRHTGNTLAAMTGASTKELMARFGQSTSRAALIYQHATQDRDHEIADALNGLIEAKLKARPTGTDGATPIG